MYSEIFKTIFDIRFLDVVDILLVAFLFYEIFNIVKGTVAVKIFFGILLIYLFWRFVKALEMELLSMILGQFISVGMIAMIIVFQQEIRNFLLIVGNSKLFSKKSRMSIFKWKEKYYNIPDFDAIVKACNNMSESSTGALIVLAKENELKNIIESGEIIDAKISNSLIETIFYKNNPLHDGAMIIVKNRIISARSVLPVSERMDFPDNLGLRHRSALGITEATDSIAIVVSEQTGKISLFKNGNIFQNVNENSLTSMLKQEFNIESV
ncbi:MAG: TIGR00159 family protein [Bacteroidetes bacterium GWE2_29_8]|nr:MAG: TIGR00159 family protein [Bacteroidetes bacterium GWE2_29_8]OFY24370.1 MAG: TIGR00159 family protein [Bacteroidetes bacterium GWF2_29_10]